MELHGKGDTYPPCCIGLFCDKQERGYHSPCRCLMFDSSMLSVVLEYDMWFKNPRILEEKIFKECSY